MKKNNIQDNFDVLRKIQKKPNTTQRELAEELGFSLGNWITVWKHFDKKVNKIENFEKSQQDKLFLCFNSAGITEKTKLTLNFMKRKMKSMMN